MSLIGEGIEVMKLLDKAKNAELYKQLAEWIDKVLALQKANDELTNERNQLKEQLRFKGSIERIKGRTFIQGDDEQICPRCAEVENRPVHLMMLPYPKLPGVRATCPACKGVTEDNRPLKRHELQQ